MEDKKPDVTGGAEGAVPVTITVRDQVGLRTLLIIERRHVVFILGGLRFPAL